MALICRALILANFILATGIIFAQDHPRQIIERKLSGLQTAATDSLRIDQLFAIANLYGDYLGDYKMADSLGEAAILLAEQSHNASLVFDACNRYLETGDLHRYNDKAIKIARRAEQNSGTAGNTGAFRLNKNLARLAMAGYAYDKALASGYRMLSIAVNKHDHEQQAESYLVIGQSLEAMNQKTEAFRNYLNATSIAEKHDDVSIKRACFDRLSDFFNLVKVYPKANHYRLQERQLILQEKPVDSVALAWNDYDLLLVSINADNTQVGGNSFTRIMNFADRRGLDRLFSYANALLRKHYIEAGRTGELYDFYTNRYPEELSRLAAENPALFLRLKAFFYEYRNKPDSALICFGQAETLMKSDPNKISRANFYNRYGQFLARHDQPQKAIDKFRESYELASEAGYFDYMLTAVAQLAKLHASRGAYEQAYYYAGLEKTLNDSIENLSRKDQLLLMEIDHETRQREIAAEHEHQLKLRRHSLQYTAITIGILTVFVLLIMLGSLKVPPWIIRMLGFFSFIFLFEFIILLADHKIHDLTHGEPWKILIIKIGLIAILLPLHHRIEKLVISYLLSHRLLDVAKLSGIGRVREMIRGKKVRKGAGEEVSREAGEQVNG